MSAVLEHANISVTDPDRTAAWMCDLFGWEIRWSGDAIHGGRSIHVGGTDSYVALYDPGKGLAEAPNSYRTRGALNHLGIVVQDLDRAEAAVKALGYEPHSHADYEPGRRFYFYDENGIEFELVEYD